ncbi:PAS domain-containing protein [Methanococcoides sp. SA1]|nr:PAS domain-containing protein [Methanococcoides sp. SA1]
MFKKLIFTLLAFSYIGFGSSLFEGSGFRLVNDHEYFRSRIIDINQDSKGNIWIINHKYGLINYDGENYKCYININKPFNLEVNDNDEIIVRARGALYIYNRDIDVFEKIIEKKMIKSPKFFSNDKIIYAGEDSLFIYNRKYQKSKLINKNLNVRDILVIDTNTVIVGTSEKLLKFNFSDSNISVQVILEGYVFKMEQDYSDHNSIWISYKNILNKTKKESISYLSKINFNKNEIEYSHQFDDKITGNDFLNIDSTFMLFGANKGMFLVDKGNYAIEEIVILKNWSPIVLKLLIDNSNTLWIATGKGLVKQYPLEDVNNFKFDQFENLINQSNSVKYICSNDTGSVWVLTGKNQINLIDNNNIKLINNNLIEKESDNLFSVIDDSKGTLYVMHKDKVAIYKTSISSKLPRKYKEIKIDNLLYMSKDRTNNIWVSNSSKLYKFNQCEIRDSLDFSNIHSLYFENDSILWCSRYSKQRIYFLKYNVVKKQITDNIIVNKNDLGNITPIFNNILYDNTSNQIFASTNRFGLYIYNLDSESGRLYSSNTGLPSNNILGIIKDLKNRIWINTSNGLMIYDNGKLSEINKSSLNCFNKINIELAEFDLPNRRTSHLLSASGENIIIGGINGVSILNTELHFNKTEWQPLVLREIKVFNNTVFKEKIQNSERQFKFSHKDDIISFSFTALNFKKLHTNKYSFLLDGLNDNWEFSDDNIITYTNLDPGTYTLKTRYSDYSGALWDGTDYKIIITPPFWQTYTFWLVMIIFLGFLVFAVIKFQTIRIRNQKKTLERRVIQKTKELHEKTDELEKVNQKLEDIVEIRTKKLSIANQQLINEVEKKEQLNIKLQESRDIIELNLKHQVILSMISMDFISLEDFEEKVYKALQTIGMEFNLSSVFILEDDHEKNDFAEFTQWLATKDLLAFPKIVYSENLEWMSSLMNNESIFIEDIIDTDPEVKSDLERFDIKGLLILPIYVNEKFFGFLGGDVRTENFNWDSSIVTLFQTVAHIISNAYERMINQNDLLESEKTSKVLLNAGDSYAVLFDDKAKIILANKNFLSLINKSLSDISGTTIYDHFPPEYVEMRELNFKKCIETGSPVQFEDKLENLFFNNIINPIFDSSGKINKIAFFSYDITKLKEAEKILLQHHEELQREVDARTKELRFINSELVREIEQRERAEKDLKISEKIKRENLKKLALQLAHEIKNPLSSIKSSAQLVETIQKMKPDDITSTLKHMEKINRNVDTCHRVINELYEFTHDAELHVQNVKTTSLYSELKEYASELGSLNSITFNGLNNAMDYTIKIDRFRILQALKNIIRNSLDAMEENGEITIEFEQYKNKLQLKISDTGSGMNKETLGKIFEPFFTSKSSGFGLGLAIVKKNIERHNGEISVESKLNIGTTTTVKLPGLIKSLEK